MIYNILTAVSPSAIPATPEITPFITPCPSILPAVEQTAEAGMNNDTLTLIVAVAALVISIISPIAAAWISGHYRLKEKELDMKSAAESEAKQYYDLHRAEVIERYITAAGKVAQLKTKDNLTEFGAAMGEMYLYTDEALWPTLSEIEYHINRGNTLDASDELAELCKALAKQGVRTKPEQQQQEAKT